MAAVAGPTQEASTPLKSVPTDFPPCIQPETQARTTPLSSDDRTQNESTKQ
jgi:hypothetical protein